MSPVPLFQGDEYAFGAGADTFVASNAGVGVDYLYVAMAQKIDFPEDLLGTGMNTFPTSNTIARVDGNEWRCHALLQFRKYHSLFF